MKRWRYEDATKTIRTVPENYWVASMDSFESSVNHKANANLIALAPELLHMLRLAAAYVGKGVADGAYNGCVVSGEKALARIEDTLRKADA
jgi:hypothetical protein